MRRDLVRALHLCAELVPSSFDPRPRRNPPRRRAPPRDPRVFGRAAADARPSAL